jgi:dynactin complex subunit
MGWLILWNEQTETQLFQISNDTAYSIKRFMSSNKFIVKTHANGVKVLTINELKSNKYSLQTLLDNKDGSNMTDSLGLLASDSQIIIAATQNEKFNGKYKSSVQVI